MQLVNRENVLNQLEAVKPGLSPREIIEQSSCFVFKDGKVMTYNDNMACALKTDLDIEGAVPSAPLLSILQKLKEEDVKVEVKEGELLIMGKGRRAGIRMEAEIMLPIDDVEQPKKWVKLHDDFADSVKLVSQTAGNDKSQFNLTCINITPNWIESCDNYQVTRISMETGVKEPTLVQKEYLRHVPELHMTKLCLTDNWIHFTNPTGLVLSCRRYIEQFPDLTGLLDVTGNKVALPKGLAEATEKASIFSSDTSDDNQVLVNLKAGKLSVKGQGSTGWFREVKKLNYKGPSLAFLISPELLVEITKQYNECIISADRLMVDGGKFKYVSCLGTVE